MNNKATKFLVIQKHRKFLFTIGYFIELFRDLYRNFLWYFIVVHNFIFFFFFKFWSQFPIMWIIKNYIIDFFYWQQILSKKNWEWSETRITTKCFFLCFSLLIMFFYKIILNDFHLNDFITIRLDCKIIENIRNMAVSETLLSYEVAQIE